MGSFPAEVSAQGGETVAIGGAHFITGTPAYVVTWTYTSEDGSTVTSVQSEPTQATSTSLIRVAAPAWPHRPAQTEYVANFVVLQYGSMLPYLGQGALSSTFRAEEPSMTDLSDGIMFMSSDINNNRAQFIVNIDDVDSDVSDIRITGESDNSSFITSIESVTPADELDSN